MKTSIVEVGGLLSVLSAQGVEKQLARLPGVKRAEVNYVAGSATVVYDESVIDLKTIKAKDEVVNPDPTRNPPMKIVAARARDCVVSVRPVSAMQRH